MTVCPKANLRRGRAVLTILADAVAKMMTEVEEWVSCSLAAAGEELTSSNDFNYSNEINSNGELPILILSLLTSLLTS